MRTSIRVLKSVVKKKYRKEWLWLEIRRLDVGKRIGVLEWPGGNELCRPRVSRLSSISTIHSPSRSYSMHNPRSG